MADAEDLKSSVLNGTCGFDSLPGYHISMLRGFHEQSNFPSELFAVVQQFHVED